MISYEKTEKIAITVYPLLQITNSNKLDNKKSILLQFAFSIYY